MRATIDSLFARIEGLVDPFAPHARTTPSKSPARFVLDHLRPFKTVMWIAAALGIVTALLELGLIWYAGRLVDLMSAGPDGFWASNWAEIVLAIVVFILLRPFAVLGAGMVNFSGISTNMIAQTRWRAHLQLLGQPVGFFQSDFAGRLSNRVMSTGVSTEDTAFILFQAFWSALAFAIATLFLLFAMDWRIALPLALWIVAFTGFILWIAPKTGRIAEKLSHRNSLVTGRVVDAYTNIETVKLFAHGKREEAYARHAMRRHRVRFGNLMRAFAKQEGAVTAFNSAAMLCVIGPALWIWTVGGLSIGDVAAAIAITMRLNTFTMFLMWMSVRVFEHFGTIREGLLSIAVPQSVTDAPQAPALNVGKGAITFHDVSHHYGRDSGGLDNIDLTIPGGQRIGLVGPSGAGKSSLLNLILRFRDVEQGTIRIDGQDIAGVTQDSLRGAIGMVTQDSSLLHRSVRDNLLYGRPDATEDQVVAAAQKAEAHEFILKLQDPKGRTGYDAQVGERGIKLSGGQRQRVALARVILKDAPLLLLDEATSALDSEIEAAIQSTLYGMMDGKTVIAIAHRLSTIARMDRIIVMSGGTIVEDGTHDSLLGNRGLYARFWERQSGGFIGLDPAGNEATT